MTDSFILLDSVSAILLSRVELGQYAIETIPTIAITSTCFEELRHVARRNESWSTRKAAEAAVELARNEMEFVGDQVLPPEYQDHYDTITQKFDLDTRNKNEGERGMLRVGFNRPETVEALVSDDGDALAAFQYFVNDDPGKQINASNTAYVFKVLCICEPNITKSNCLKALESAVDEEPDWNWRDYKDRYEKVF